MTLVLEIEFLAGVSFAAIGPDSPVPDWPPQPDRIFSALVASWAARGQYEEETRALEWLERLEPPRILASDASARSAHAVYVPPNDYETPKGALDKLKWYRDFLSQGIRPPETGGHKKLWLQAWDVMPGERRRSGLKERGFPAAWPGDPCVRLFWMGATPDERKLAALIRLARDTSYIGHSSSLTRCRFLLAQGTPDLSEASLPELRVYPGRFQELRDAYARFERSASGTDRPQKGAPATRRSGTTQSRVSSFGDRWLLLEHVSGDMPELRASALVARTIRDALLAGYQRVGLGDRIPEVVSGHTPDGTPTRRSHIAIVPMAFVGFPHADGHVMGFAIVPPCDEAILGDEDFRRALRILAPMDEERGRRILTIRTKEGTPRDQAFSIELSPSFEAGRRSLDPALYIARACTFATVTPIALDRHLKAKGNGRQDEIRAQIAAACRNIGLPEPEAISANKHSAIEGAPSAYPSGKSPAWLGWRTPPSLASRQLTHAVIRFPEPVDGPVILGAGRFVGLGLCRPLDPED